MMSWLTDTRFLVGVAIGFFVAPRVATFVKSKLSSGSAAS